MDEENKVEGQENVQTMLEEFDDAYETESEDEYEEQVPEDAPDPEPEPEKPAKNEKASKNTGKTGKKSGGKAESKKNKNGKGGIVFVIFTLVLVLGIAAWMIIKARLSMNVSKTLEKAGGTIALSSETGVLLDSMSNIVLRASSSGIGIYAETGELLKDIACDMQKPSLAVGEAYAALADRMGSEAVLISANGEYSKVLSDGNVFLHCVGDSGLMALVTEVSDGHELKLFNTSGNCILTRRTYSEKDGIPIAVALSPDGSRMVTASVYYAGATLRSVLTVFDLSSTGSTLVDRIVGSKQIEELLVTELFINGNTCFYVGNSKIGSFSIKNGCEDLWQTGLTYQIDKVAFTNGALGILYGAGMAGVSNATDTNFFIYGADGTVKYKSYEENASFLTANASRFIVGSDYIYKGVSLEGKVLWTYNGTQVYGKLLPLAGDNRVAAAAVSKIDLYIIIRDED